MNPDNRWVKKAATIPWDEIETRYAKLFPSTTGMPAKPLRAALGSLLIQKQYGYSDREMVVQITENPYYQYFIGLPGYTMEPPFVPSLMVEFRKKLDDDILAEVNEMIIEYDKPDNPGSGGNCSGDGSDDCSKDDNPQDINLLNEARMNLEGMIDTICKANHAAKPRTYRRKAHKDYLELAKCKKQTSKKTRKAIRRQLQYIRRDLKHLLELMETYGDLPKKQMIRLKTIQTVYEQQKYMYDNKIHTVYDRIVSLSQPYIRPIVWGKAAAPVDEFGAKLDLSLDETGMARIEKLSYDAYNESEVLITVVEHYRERTGHYPERVLADQINRNRKNIRYCKEHGIRLSGPKLGRPKAEDKSDKKIAYQYSVNRIEIERAFSLAKRNYGLGLITTRLDTTSRSSIALSVLAMNVVRIAAIFLHSFEKFSVARVILECVDEHFRYHRPMAIMKLSRYIRPLLRLVYEQTRHYEFSVAC